MNKRRLFSVFVAVCMVATIVTGTIKWDIGIASEKSTIDKITIVHTNDTHGRYKYDENHNSSNINTNHTNKEDKNESLSKKPIKTGDESNISMFSIIICIASFAISVYIFIQLTKKK